MHSSAGSRSSGSIVPSWVGDCTLGNESPDASLLNKLEAAACARTEGENSAAATNGARTVSKMRHQFSSRIEKPRKSTCCVSNKPCSTPSLAACSFE
eukprot:6185793-Pleurochrysis_carterae.AAC.1